MATDYISTTPWDNPENPWPFYSIVNVQADNIPAATLTLADFNPVTGFVQYLGGAGNGTYLNYTEGQGWVVGNSAGGAHEYGLATNVRAVPTKTLGTAQGWVANAGGGSPAGVIVTPNTTSQTDWSKRRLWNLNG